MRRGGLGGYSLCDVKTDGTVYNPRAIEGSEAWWYFSGLAWDGEWCYTLGVTFAESSIDPGHLLRFRRDGSELGEIAELNLDEGGNNYYTAIVGGGHSHNYDGGQLLATPEIDFTGMEWYGFTISLSGTKQHLPTNVRVPLGGAVWGCGVHPDGTWYWYSSNRQLFACDKGSGALTLLGSVVNGLAPATSIAFDSTGKGYIGGSIGFQTFSVESLTATAGPNYTGDPGGGPRYIIVDG